MSDMSGPDRVAQLEAENEKLRDRVCLLESRCGHLMVDADRREERARKEAGSCEKHGEEITYLRHLASWCWSNGQTMELARQAIVTRLILLTRDQLGGHDTVPVDALSEWLQKCIDAQKKPMREPGFPTLADCQRAGGCEHDGLSPSLMQEVRRDHRAVVHPASTQDVLFGGVA